jgi:hypothetical protein
MGILSEVERLKRHVNGFKPAGPMRWLSYRHEAGKVNPALFHGGIEKWRRFAVYIPHGVAYPIPTFAPLYSEAE